MVNTLIVITGPTAVGKTALTIELAKHYDTPVINADSRQIYRELKIGTASPTEEQLSEVKHYFVGTKSITDYYNASMYEQDVLDCLKGEPSKTQLLSGGSMMYIDAVCRGLDDIPTIEAPVRMMMQHRLESEGLSALVEELRVLDPEYFAEVDRRNTRRVVHALEVIYQTGRKMSSFRRRNTQKNGLKPISLPNIIKLQFINRIMDSERGILWEKRSKNCCLPLQRQRSSCSSHR